MSSRILYPPILDSYMPAFVASGAGAKCRVFFSLSKFNKRTDFSSAHVSIVKQDNGLNMVSKTDNVNHAPARYRATGIILNVPVYSDPSHPDMWYIDIENEDLMSNDGVYKGWQPGWIYKIQIRLSSKDFDNTMGQSAWLNLNAGSFSEWSTVCITKAIGPMTISIPSIGYTFVDKGNSVNLTSNQTTVLYVSSLDIIGTYSNEDKSETLHSYYVEVLNNNGDVIETTDLKYSNQYVDGNQFNITLKTEFENNKSYFIKFHYSTINHYNGIMKLGFTINYGTNNHDIMIYSLENDEYNLLSDYTTVYEEEEEGRIALKLHDYGYSFYNVDVCIRRTDSRSNFKEWTDIKIFPLRNQDVNDLPIFYDYTVESGVWYMYGVQTITATNERTILNKMEEPIIRNFEFSYLLGENNQQLKLRFNNTINSFRNVVSDSKLETIGGRYPFITRNGKINYKSFPISGLISFNMDDNHLFITKEELFGDEVAALYAQYNRDHYISDYDYTYEREFRDAVLKFLQNDKPKLYKSPTEGNILVRITDINCTPNQSLSRLIYSFSGTATEVAEPTPENYFKYNLAIKESDTEQIFEEEELLGQIYYSTSLPLGDNKFARENIMDYIAENFQLEQAAFGYDYSIKGITNVSIAFLSDPFVLGTNPQNSKEEYVGFPITYNGNTFIASQFYDFDEAIFNIGNKFFIGPVPSVNPDNRVVEMIIYFTYTVVKIPSTTKRLKSKTKTLELGQLNMFNVSADTLLNKKIYYKHYYEDDNIYRYVDNIGLLSINAPVGATFSVETKNGTSETYIVGSTGSLDFEEILFIRQIKYTGITKNSVLNPATKANVKINYQYTEYSGYFKN